MVSPGHAGWKRRASIRGMFESVSVVMGGTQEHRRRVARCVFLSCCPFFGTLGGARN